MMQVFFCREDEDVVSINIRDEENNVHVKKLQFEPINLKETPLPVKIAVIDDKRAQEILDNLWRLGIRPTIMGYFGLCRNFSFDVLETHVAELKKLDDNFINKYK